MFYRLWLDPHLSIQGIARCDILPSHHNVLQNVGRKTEEKRVSQKQEALERRREKSARKSATPVPDVVYTPAKPLNRNRVLLRLATVVAVVLAYFGGSLLTVALASSAAVFLTEVFLKL